MLVSEKHGLTLEIEKLAEKYGRTREALLPILQDIQMRYGYVSEFAQQEIANFLDIHPVEVYGVVTFYAFLSREPEGRYIVKLCQTIACDLAGKEAIARAIERELGIKFGDTTPDKKFTLQYINCMGMCDQGPALLVNDDVYTHLTPHKAVEIIKSYK